VFTNNKRIIILMIISVIMNTLLFSIAYFLNIPLWLDTTGTIYVACILGAPAGFLVAIINNVIEAVFFYGDQSLVFYFVSLVTAFVAGRVSHSVYFKNKRVRKWMCMMILLIIVGGLSSILITLVANGGIPTNYWSNRLYYACQNRGVTNVWSCVIAVMAVKIPDIVVSVLIVILSIGATPRKLKTGDMVILNTYGETR